MPVKKERLAHAYARRKGAFVIDADDLENQWIQENPRLHQETMILKDRLVERFTPRTFNLYKGIPTDFVEYFAPTIRAKWDDHLKDCALRTYAWFTPNSPALIPVRVKR